MKLTGKEGKHIRKVYGPRNEYVGIAGKNALPFFYTGPYVNQKFSFGQDLMNNGRPYAIPFSQRLCYYANSSLYLPVSNGKSVCWSNYSGSNISIRFKIGTIKDNISGDIIPMVSTPYIGFSKTNRCNYISWGHASLDYYIVIKNGIIYAKDSVSNTDTAISNTPYIDSTELLNGKVYDVELVRDNSKVLLYIDNDLIYTFPTSPQGFYYPMFVSSHLGNDNGADGSFILANITVKYNTHIPVALDALQPSTVLVSLNDSTSTDKIYQYGPDYYSREQAGLIRCNPGNLLVSPHNAGVNKEFNALHIPAVNPPYILQGTLNVDNIKTTYDADIYSKNSAEIDFVYDDDTRKYITIQQYLQSRSSTSTINPYMYVFNNKPLGVETLTYSYTLKNISYYGSTSIFDGLVSSFTNGSTYSGTETYFISTANPASERSIPDLQALVDDVWPAYQSSLDTAAAEYNRVYQQYLPAIQNAGDAMELNVAYIEAYVKSTYASIYSWGTYANTICNAIMNQVASGIFNTSYNYVINVQGYSSASDAQTKMNNRAASIMNAVRQVMTGASTPSSQQSYAIVTNDSTVGNRYNQYIINALNYAREFYLTLGMTNVYWTGTFTITVNGSAGTISGEWTTQPTLSTTSLTFDFNSKYSPSFSYNYRDISTSDGSSASFKSDIIRISIDVPYIDSSTQCSGDGYISSAQLEGTGPTAAQNFYHSTAIETLSNSFHNATEKYRMENYATLAYTSRNSNYNTYYNASSNSSYRQVISRLRDAHYLYEVDWETAVNAFENALSYYYSLYIICSQYSSQIYDALNTYNTNIKYNAYDRYKNNRAITALSSRSVSNKTTFSSFVSPLLNSYNNETMMLTNGEQAYVTTDKKSESIIFECQDKYKWDNLFYVPIFPKHYEELKMASQRQTTANNYIMQNEKVVKSGSTTYAKLVNNVAMKMNHISFRIDKLSDPVYLVFGDYAATPVVTSTIRLNTTSYGMQLLFQNGNIQLKYSTSSTSTLVSNNLTEGDEIDILVYLYTSGSTRYYRFKIFKNSELLYTYSTTNSYVRLGSNATGFMSALLLTTANSSASYYINEVIEFDKNSYSNFNNNNNVQCMPNQGVLEFLDVHTSNNTPCARNMISDVSVSDVSTIKSNKWTSSVSSSNYTPYVMFDSGFLLDENASAMLQVIYLLDIKSLELSALIDGLNARAAVGFTTSTNYTNISSMYAAATVSFSGSNIILEGDIQGTKTTLNTGVAWRSGDRYGVRIDVEGTYASISYFVDTKEGRFTLSSNVPSLLVLNSLIPCFSISSSSYYLKNPGVKYNYKLNIEDPDILLKNVEAFLK